MAAGSMPLAEPSYASLFAASDSSCSTRHYRDIHIINTYPLDSRISPHTPWHVRTWPAVRPVNWAQPWVIKAGETPNLHPRYSLESHMFGTVGQHWPPANIAGWSTSTLEATSKPRTTPVLSAGSYRDMFVRHQLLRRMHLPARDLRHGLDNSALSSHEQGPSWNGRLEAPQEPVHPSPPQWPRTQPPPPQPPPSQPPPPHSPVPQPQLTQPLPAQPTLTKPPPSQPPLPQPPLSQPLLTRLPPPVPQATQSPPSQPLPLPCEPCKSQAKPALLATGDRIIMIADGIATPPVLAARILQPESHTNVTGLLRAFPHQLDTGTTNSRTSGSSSGATVPPHLQRPFSPQPSPQPLPPHLRSVIGSIADVRPAEMPPEPRARPDPVLLTQLPPLHTLPSPNQLAAGLSSLELRMDCAVHSLSALSSLSCLASLACLQPALDPAAATTAARTVATISSYGEADSCVVPAAALDWSNQEYDLDMGKPSFVAQGSIAKHPWRADSSVPQDLTPPSDDDAMAGLRGPAHCRQLSRQHNAAETGANGGCNSGSGRGGVPSMARRRLLKTWRGGVLAEGQQLLRPAPLAPAETHPPKCNTRSSAPRSSHISVTGPLQGNVLPAALHADGGHGGDRDAATVAAAAAADGAVLVVEMAGGGPLPPGTTGASQRPDWTACTSETVAAAVVLSSPALQQLVAETARASAAAATAALELCHSRHVLQLQQQLQDHQSHQSNNPCHVNYHDPHNQLEATLSLHRRAAPQLHRTSVDVTRKAIRLVNESAVCSGGEDGEDGKGPGAMEQPQLGRLRAPGLESCGMKGAETMLVVVAHESARNDGGFGGVRDIDGSSNIHGAEKLSGQEGPTTRQQQLDRRHTLQRVAAVSARFIPHKNSRSGSCDSGSSIASWDYITLYPTQVMYVDGTERLDVGTSDPAPASPSAPTPSVSGVTSTGGGSQRDATGCKRQRPGDAEAPLRPEGPAIDIYHATSTSKYAASEETRTVQQTQEVEVVMEEVDELPDDTYSEARDGSEPRGNGDDAPTGYTDDGASPRLPAEGHPSVDEVAGEASKQIRPDSSGRDRDSDATLSTVRAAAGISGASADPRQLETKSETAATMSGAAERREAKRQPADSNKGSDSSSSSSSSTHNTGSIRAGAAHATRDIRAREGEGKGSQQLEENTATRQVTARGKEPSSSTAPPPAPYMGPPHDDGSRSKLGRYLSGEDSVQGERAEDEEGNDEDDLTGLRVASGSQDAVHVSTGLFDPGEQILASPSASYVDEKDADISEEDSLQQRSFQMEDEVYGDSTDVWTAEAATTGEQLVSDANTDAEAVEGPAVPSQQLKSLAANADGDKETLKAGSSGIGHEASDRSLSFSISFSTLVGPDASPRNKQNSVRSGGAILVPVSAHSSLPPVVKRLGA